MNRANLSIKTALSSFQTSLPTHYNQTWIPNRALSLQQYHHHRYLRINTSIQKASFHQPSTIHLLSISLSGQYSKHQFTKHRSSWVTSANLEDHRISQDKMCISIYFQHECDHISSTPNDIRSCGHYELIGGLGTGAASRVSGPDWLLQCHVQRWILLDYQNRRRGLSSLRVCCDDCCRGRGGETAQWYIQQDPGVGSEASSAQETSGSRWTIWRQRWGAEQEEKIAVGVDLLGR